MQVEKIFIGGWFQRTRLHLAEIYDFLKDAESPLALDRGTLRKHRAKLNIQNVDLHVEELEYISLETSNRIVVKIFEDGLITLSKEHDHELEEDINILTEYYEDRLSPGISYLFSLGAPVPKELANIKTIYPYFVVLKNAKAPEIKHLLDDFHEEKYFEVKKPSFQIFRGNKLYIINNKREKIEVVERFMQEQIFIREFRGQMHRYLNIHRIIWEKIAAVKEQGEIRGSEVETFYKDIESYAKTINLIDARINQMDAYVKTREKMAKESKALQKFMPVLEFKYETLIDTHSYVRDIWTMTKNYVKSAQDVFGVIRDKATESSIKNLAVITLVGVGIQFIKIFGQEEFTFTIYGLYYLVLIIAFGFAANKLLKWYNQRKMYKIKEPDLAQDIQ